MILVGCRRQLVVFRRVERQGKKALLLLSRTEFVKNGGFIDENSYSYDVSHYSSYPLQRMNFKIINSDRQAGNLDRSLLRSYWVLQFSSL